MKKNKSPKSAWEAALDCLSRRALTKRELETRLNNKGYESSEIQSAVDKLLGYGYLNDHELALTYAKSRLHRYSRRRVTVDMRNRGIDADLIEQVLEEVYSWNEEANLCLALAQKWRVQEEQRWEEKALKDSDKMSVPLELWVQQRIVRKLIQRGYPSDIVQNVLAKMRIE